MTDPFVEEELFSRLASLPALGTIAQSTAFTRAHPHLFGSTEFDRRAGQEFRFSTIRFAGQVVPVIYAAESAEVAAYETVFRNVYDRDTPRRPKRVFLDRYATWQWSDLVTRNDVRRLSLDPDTLNRLNVDPQSVTSSPPSGYPQSRLFAETVLRALPDCDAMSWTSAQFGSGTSYVFFGQVSGRPGGLPREAFGGIGASLPFASSSGADQLAHTANILGITLVAG